MNGEALRYTCCNRRAHQIANGVRDSNGCTSAFHGGGRSAWQRHGTVSAWCPPVPALGSQPAAHVCGDGVLLIAADALLECWRCRRQRLTGARFPLGSRLLQGVKPRELPPEPAAPSSLDRSSSGGGSGTASSTKGRSSSLLVGSGGSSGGSSSRGRSSSPQGSLPGSPARPSPDPQEWHPNQRPGLLELPSRLFSSSGSGAA